MPSPFLHAERAQTREDTLEFTPVLNQCLEILGTTHTDRFRMVEITTSRKRSFMTYEEQGCFKTRQHRQHQDNKAAPLNQNTTNIPAEVGMWQVNHRELGWNPPAPPPTEELSQPQFLFERELNQPPHFISLSSHPTQAGNIPGSNITQPLKKASKPCSSHSKVCSEKHRPVGRIRYDRGNILRVLDEGKKIRCCMAKQNKIQLRFGRTMTIHLCDCTKYQPRDCHINLQWVKT